ncbi:hypothetical protein [Pseudonocardia dioxanivorans]|uniref:hypothetical protein n=1 Tax=Pseudonocardia dioxanivorans TaxID=240495 RepID=UPI000CD142D3|nr:hypothetical protein [Pseudonocardia dioxanivorans]
MTTSVTPESILEAQGLPTSDSHELPSSGHTFDDGGHFRLEVSGVERLQNLETLLAEAKRHDVFVHRIICFGGGATLLDKGELRAFGQLAAENGIEVVAVPGPRAGWDTGRHLTSAEGITSGKRIRGIDNIRYLLHDLLRIYASGIRGALVIDEGVLDILNRARLSGDIPEDAFFKVSVYSGHANPAAVRVLEGLGADSVNPVGDLSRPMLSAIRSAVSVPLDVWAITFDSFGGITRLWEAADIARVAAPVYFKIEPGESEEVMYNGYTDAEFHDRLIVHKVRHAAILRELAATVDSSVTLSPPRVRVG